MPTTTPNFEIAMPATTPAPADVAAMSTLTLVETAKELGFTFTRSPTDPTDVRVTPPRPVGPNAALILAVDRRLRDPAGATALLSAATAAGLQPSGLRAPPPRPPQKVGHDRHGQKLTVPDLPPPPPPEPPHFAVRSTIGPVGSLSPVEFRHECDAISTEWEVIRRKLTALPEEADEPHEVQAERERLTARWAFLQRRAQALEERRQRELFEHVDQVAHERQLAADGGPRVPWPAAWHSGRMV